MSKAASNAWKWSPYLGKSGHLAVMAEFTARGYNVAMPEIDRGDDIFVVEDSDGNIPTLSRVQVKTARATGKATLAARFTVRWEQLQKQYRPDLKFVLAVRHQDRWLVFLVIDRNELALTHDTHNIGTVSGQGSKRQIKFNVRRDARSGKWYCGGVDFSCFVNAFLPDLTR